jgi:hypothetical protein
LFLRHQTMDKVQKHNSFNTNTPSSESYRNYLVRSIFRLTVIKNIKANLECKIVNGFGKYMYSIWNAPLHICLFLVLRERIMNVWVCGFQRSRRDCNVQTNPEDLQKTCYDCQFYKYSTPWRRVLCQNLVVVQLIKKFPTFYGTRSFITMFIRVRHWAPSWASRIQSKLLHLI